MSATNPSNWRTETILENAVGIVLEVLKEEGHIIEDFQLMRSKKLPDFWVLDSRGRSYLLECKNLRLKRYNEPLRHYNGTNYQGVSTWFWNARWVRENLLDKRWHPKKSH
jgi:hypothetical protein